MLVQPSFLLLNAMSKYVPLLTAARTHKIQLNNIFDAISFYTMSLSYRSIPISTSLLAPCLILRSYQVRHTTSVSIMGKKSYR